MSKASKKRGKVHKLAWRWPRYARWTMVGYANRFARDALARRVRAQGALAVTYTTPRYDSAAT